MVGRQVEGLSDRNGHLIFGHLLFSREMEDSSDRRVLEERQTGNETGKERRDRQEDTQLPTCLALSDSFLQTAATSLVSVGNLCWQ